MLVCMGKTHVAALQVPRELQHPLLDKPLTVFDGPQRIIAKNIIIVFDRAFHEVGEEYGTIPRYSRGDSQSPRNLLQTLAELFAQPVNMLMHRLVLQQLDGSQRRGAAHGIPVISPSIECVAPGVSVKVVHALLLPADRRKGKPVRHRFPQRGEMGIYSADRLKSAQVM